MANEVLDLAKELSELGVLIERAPNLDDFLDAGLTWLALVAPFDLATVWQVDGDRLWVRTAHGRLTSRKVLQHEIDLNTHKDLRRVLAGRVPRLNTEHDHTDGDGDLFDGVLDLTPGHSCMVVPLYAGERTLGLLSLDRNVCEAYSGAALQLVDLYARILALGMLVAAEAQRYGALYRAEKARTTILQEDAEPGDPVAVLAATLSPTLAGVLSQARAVAATESAVLILGETGVGKEVMAQAVHRWSARHAGPFIKLNCAAVPEAMLESELFGHVKGAFTGASRDRDGRFRVAHGGAIFLDEIGEMPVALQAKLLRVLQEGSFEPVGSDRTIKVDVRIIAATNVNLEEAIRRKTFREDLYYRIHVFPLTLPPLRERPEDLQMLADHFLRRFRPRGGRPQHLGRAGLAQLRAYPWPGNVRELGNVLERASILAASHGTSDVTPFLALAPGRAAPLTVPDVAADLTLLPLDEAIRRHIKKALALTGGKIYGEGGAAALLGLKPSTLQSKMARLKIR